MSAVLPRDLLPASHGPAAWVAAWSRMNVRDLVAWLLVATVMTAIDLTSVVDKLGHPAITRIAVAEALASLIFSGIALLAWRAVADLPGDRSTRLRRALVAIVIAAALSTVLVVALFRIFDIDRLWWELAGKMKSPPQPTLLAFGFFLNFALWAGVYFAAGELERRRKATGAAILAAQREQATLARGVLESKLAAMQAQVEPQFLFDTLVAIEAQYERDTRAASDNLDRLITYLRVALPRLREAGSTVGAELELLRAYLDVVRSVGGAPTLAVTLAPDCRDARFYPMLLLPLVQRAVRDASGAASSVRIGVDRVGDEIVIVLRLGGRASCGEDAELARVRERLVGLYGARATLECCELAGPTTQFTLRVPAAVAPAP
jgi:hypothetical protein